MSKSTVTEARTWVITIRRDDGEYWPDMPVRHSRHGKMFRPDTLVVSLRAGERTVRGSLGGHPLRKDGSLSIARATETYYGEHEFPEWAQDMAEQARRYHGLGEGTVMAPSRWGDAG